MQIKNLNVYFFFLALVVISVLAFILFKPFLVAIIIAVILAVAFRRPYKFFLRITNNRKSLSSFLASLLVFLVIFIPTISVFGLLANEANETYKRFVDDREFYHGLIDNTVNFLENAPVIQLFDVERFLSPDQLASSLSNLSEGFLGFIQKTYQNIAHFILLTFVMFFTLYYFFIEGDNLLKKVMYMSPLRDKYESYLVERFVSMTRATLKGTLVIGLIQGVLAGITFAIAGIPSSVIWGVVMTILSIIPAIGPAVVMIPAAIILFFMGSIWQGVFILIMAIGIISTIDNILRPKLVGRDTQMHPLLIFFATLGGIIVFKIPGFIIGPIIMALFLAFWQIYAQEFKKQLSKYNS